jgi:hypothetical protein
MRIGALRTGLFADAETVDAAVAVLEAGHRVRRVETPADAADDAAWDDTLAALLGADLVVTI